MGDDALLRLTISEEASIRTAMEAIDRGAVEIALMVDGSGCLVGTVSDGDIRRALLSGDSLEDAVMPHVSTQPTTVDPSSSRAEVLDLMRARSLSQIPVVGGDGRLAGLHVMRDLLGATHRPNAAVIMAGGRGSRLGSITQSSPKPMLKVAGRPILERLVLHLVGSGIRRVLISVNYLSEVIEDHFGDGSEYGCSIQYLHEDPETPLGTAGSLSLIDDADALGHPLLVMNGDLVTDFSVGDLLTNHADSGAIATVAVGRYEHRIPFGVAVAEGGRLTELVEKPVESWQVNGGIYVLEPAIVRRVPRGTEHHVTDLLADCLAHSEHVNVWRLSSDWQDIGRPTELKRARGEL